MFRNLLKGRANFSLKLPFNSVRSSFPKKNTRNAGTLTKYLDRFHNRYEKEYWYPYLGLAIPLTPFIVTFILENYNFKRQFAYPAKTERKSNSQTKAMTHNTLIMGGGPAGLLHALVACKHGDNKVILVTDRYHYPRDQVLVIQGEFFSGYTGLFLRNILSDKTIEELTRDKKLVPSNGYSYPSYYVIRTRTLEETLYKELLKYSGHKLEVIYQDRKNSLTTNEINSASLFLRDGANNNIIRQIDFQHLIVANGAHSNIVEQIRRHRPQTNYSSYLGNFGKVTNDAINLIHKDYMVAIYQLPEKSTAAQYEAMIANGLSYKQPKIYELNKLGWTLNSLPEVRLFAVDGVMHVGAEAPTNLQNDKEAIDRWAKTVLKFYLPSTAIQGLTLSSKKCNYNKFALDFKVIKQASTFVQEPQEGSDYFSTITVVGDAAKDEHFLAAGGFNRILEEGLAYERLLTSLSKAQDKSLLRSWESYEVESTRRIRLAYNDYFKALEFSKKTTNTNTSAFLSNRKNREEEATRAKNPKPREPYRFFSGGSSSSYGAEDTTAFQGSFNFSSSSYD